MEDGVNGSWGMGVNKDVEDWGHPGWRTRKIEDIHNGKYWVLGNWRIGIWRIGFV